MKYAVLIYAEPSAHEAQGEEEFQSMFQEYMALVQDSRTIQPESRAKAAKRSMLYL